MTVAEQIDEDLKAAMRAKESHKVETLRMLKSALKYAAMEGGAPDDESTYTVLRKEIKKREDSVASYQKGNRPDLAEKEEKEIALIRHYLPAAMSDEEVDKLVQEAMAEVTRENPGANLGHYMKAASAKAAGRVDNKRLSEAIRKFLG